MRSLLASLCCIIGACDDDGGSPGVSCLSDYRDGTLSTDCFSAKELAVRDSNGLVVSQPEIDWYLDVYQRGFVPLAPYLGAPPITATWWPHLTATSSAERFTGPWLRGEIVTGVHVVDAVLAQAHIDVITPLGMMRGPYFSLASSTHVVVNRNVSAALQGVEGLEVSATEVRLPEGFAFTDALIESGRPGAQVADIVYRLGWGDCFVQCQGQVSWRVRVTPTTASLLASWVWGEPAPPHILELWQQPNPNR